MAVISFGLQLLDIGRYLIALGRSAQQLVVQLVKTVCGLVVDIVFFVKKLIKFLVKWLWVTYSSVEKQLLEFFIDTGFTIYSIRFLLLLFLPGIIFFINSLWVPLGVYIILLVTAFFRRFKLDVDDIKREENNFSKLRDKLTLIFHTPFRVIISLCLICFSYILFLGIGFNYQDILIGVKNEAYIIIDRTPKQPSTLSEDKVAHEINRNVQREVVKIDINTMDTDSRFTKSDTTDIETLEISHDTEKQLHFSEYKARLSICDLFFNCDILIIGKNGSAFQCYKEILLSDPDNKKALEGIRNIKKRYAELIRAELSIGNTIKAEKLFVRLSIIGEDAPVLQQLLFEIRRTVPDQVVTGRVDPLLKSPGIGKVYIGVPHSVFRRDQEYEDNLYIGPWTPEMRQ